MVSDDIRVLRCWVIPLPGAIDIGTGNVIPGKQFLHPLTLLLCGEIVSRYRLVEARTGSVIRHYIRTLPEAERERRWYEEETGKEIRIMKLFRSDGYQ
jgi:hypothetical protein